MGIVFAHWKEKLLQHDTKDFPTWLTVTANWSNAIREAWIAFTQVLNTVGDVGLQSSTIDFSVNKTIVWIWVHIFKGSSTCRMMSYMYAVIEIVSQYSVLVRVTSLCTATYIELVESGMFQIDSHILSNVYTPISSFRPSKWPSSARCTTVRYVWWLRLGATAREVVGSKFITISQTISDFHLKQVTVQ